MDSILAKTPPKYNLNEENMMNLNRVTIIGVLLTELKLNYTKSGRPVANGVIVSKHQWFDKSSLSNRYHIERTNLALFDTLAIEAIEQIAPGTKIFIEGHLKTKHKEGDSGNYLYRTHVVVERFEPFTGKNEKMSRFECHSNESQT